MNRGILRCCEICHGEFHVKPNVVRNGNGRFCSSKCRVAWMRSRRGALIHNFQGGPRRLLCRACKREFGARRAEPGRQFCSMACRDVYRRGDKHHAWIDGRTMDARAYGRSRQRLRYALTRAPGSLTLAQWEEIKTRYGHLCPACGKRDNQAALSMDHIRPVRDGGLTTADNIQPLCRSCNCKKHTRTVFYDPDGSALEITDFSALVRAVAAGQLPPDVLSPNQFALDAAVRAQREGFQVPGVESVCQKVAAAGSR